MQLVKEKAPVASFYNGRSVAEQNSVNLAWTLFMEPDYDKFSQALCSSTEERRRFRQLVVNSVLATDIMDADLKLARNNRWTKAFSSTGSSSIATPAEQESGLIIPPSCLREEMSRKATVVLEHLIQASDIAHTMQHWTIYQKWNSRLFREMISAYHNGRSDKNPADSWYQGELGFFDFYVIPLAKKLKDCGVFGVSSDEYLNYALQNRAEWERRGPEAVSRMVEDCMVQSPDCLVPQRKSETRCDL